MFVFERAIVSVLHITTFGRSAVNARPKKAHAQNWNDSSLKDKHFWCVIQKKKCRFHLDSAHHFVQNFSIAFSIEQLCFCLLPLDSPGDGSCSTSDNLLHFGVLFSHNTSAGGAKGFWSDFSDRRKWVLKHEQLPDVLHAGGGWWRQKVAFKLFPVQPYRTVGRSGETKVGSTVHVTAGEAIVITTWHVRVILMRTSWSGFSLEIRIESVLSFNRHQVVDSTNWGQGSDWDSGRLAVITGVGYKILRRLGVTAEGGRRGVQG